MLFSKNKSPTWCSCLLYLNLYPINIGAVPGNGRTEKLSRLGNIFKEIKRGAGFWKWLEDQCETITLSQTTHFWIAADIHRVHQLAFGATCFANQKSRVPDSKKIGNPNGTMNSDLAFEALYSALFYQGTCGTFVDCFAAHDFGFLIHNFCRSKNPLGRFLKLFKKKTPTS